MRNRQRVETVTNSERNKMSHRKNGLRAFGLLVMSALGLMAFSAAGAQAEVGSNFDG